MSSTRRGQRKDGEETNEDFYETPGWAVDRLFEDPVFKRALIESGAWGEDGRTYRWFEPGGGHGALIKRVGVLLGGTVRWTTCDLRPEACAILRAIPDVDEVHQGDYVWMGGIPELRGRRFDAVLGNPPFYLAQQFVEQSLPMTDFVCLLFRGNYWGSQERNEFMRATPPDLYGVPDRIDFSKDGQGDSVEHAWHVWSRERSREAGSLRVLRTTPIQVRRMWRKL